MSEAENYTSQQASDPQTPPQVLADIAALRGDLRPAVASNPSAYPGLLQWLGGLGEPGVDAALRARGAAPAAEPRTAPAPGNQPWQGQSAGVGQGHAPGQGYPAGQGYPTGAPGAPYGSVPAGGGYPTQPSGLGSPPSTTAYGSAPGGYGAAPAGAYGGQQGQQPYGAPGGQQYGYQAAGTAPKGGGSKKALWITLAVVGVLVLLGLAAFFVIKNLADQLPEMGEGSDERLELLYDQCAEGDGQACDDLFFESPAGSEYEEFGDTCGGRTEGGSLCVNELD